ncbi:sugar transferase, partial [Hymenobacter crusticola]
MEHIFSLPSVTSRINATVAQPSFLKRAFDIVFASLVLLFLLSWLVPLIALIIKIDSRGPVFFKQLRT